MAEAMLMNRRWFHLTPIQLGRFSMGCLVAATWGGAYGDAPTTTPPPHWFISGQEYAQAIKEYSGAIDHTNAYEGSGSGLLKSTSDAAHNGTLMQVSSAAAYRGKSVKMSAFLRSTEVAKRAGLWIRADDINGATVAFRNSFSPRAPQSFVQGSTAWKEVDISIDIPDSAVALSYGVQMAGTGAVWIDSVSIDVIGPYATAYAEQVFPTVHPRPDPQTLSPTPQNLNFEQ
jgi:flagellar basal body rod protein FlgC